MIATIRHKGLRRFVEQDDRSKLPADMVERIREILTVLSAADCIEALDLPGYRLHQLKGSRKGDWSITVRANWRITFKFEGSKAYDVDFEDYH